MKNPLTSLIEYFRSSKAELEKVTWPSRQETIRYSLLVIGVSAATAAFFATLDFGLGKGVDLALKGRTTSAPTQPIVPDLEPATTNDAGSPTVEGVDEEGNRVPIQITPIPLDGSEDQEGGFTVTQ